MRKSTIKLTKHELNFALDTSYPLAKHQIVQKVSQLFQQLGQKLVRNLAGHPLIGAGDYKITRGENYRLMPYMVLDFPRIKGNGFPVVCRTMFWWGHYFSCNLIVQTALIDPQATAAALAFKPKVRLLTGDHLWEQDLNSKTYTRLGKLSAAEILPLLQHQDYLKLSVKIGIKKQEELEELATGVYSSLLSLICIKKGA